MCNDGEDNDGDGLFDAEDPDVVVHNFEGGNHPLQRSFKRPIGSALPKTGQIFFTKGESLR